MGVWVGFVFHSSFLYWYTKYHHPNTKYCIVNFVIEYFSISFFLFRNYFSHFTIASFLVPAIQKHSPALYFTHGCALRLWSVIKVVYPKRSECWWDPDPSLLTVQYYQPWVKGPSCLFSVKCGLKDGPSITIAPLSFCRIISMFSTNHHSRTSCQIFL